MLVPVELRDAEGEGIVAVERRDAGPAIQTEPDLAALRIFTWQYATLLPAAGVMTAVAEVTPLVASRSLPDAASAVQQNG